ncbi:uncharacterized protein LOC108136012 [Drosophila elegans]|uniref:uncharacterized protein LOC108136012 n=1 Tax=Drosophila elegans TaxID=30023 RepID=UPI0007E5D0EC|nr:uncharacterized protein LOC108136012 [Drosophila elegans]
MIPISSAKLNSKLATRSLLNEGRSNKKSCVCLLVGMALGVCLAGIIFYSSLPNEDYSNKSKNLLQIIGLEKPKNVSQSVTTKSINLAKALEAISVASTTLNIKSTQETTDELNNSDDSLNE